MAKRITIKASINALAKELQIERATMEARAAKMNVPLRERLEAGDLSLRDLVLIAAGDRNTRRARLEEIKIEREERENLKEAGELVNLREAIEDFKAETIAPFKTALVDLARKRGFEPELKKLMEGFLK